MARHRSIGEFDAQREDWTSYSERLLEYFTANKVEGTAKKKAILLSVVGAPIYQFIRNLVAPNKLTENTFEEPVKLMQGNYQPSQSVIVHRFKCAQQQGESVATFVSELRRLSEHCRYGESLEEMLRYRIVRRTTNNQLQKRLLAEPKLTFKKALELAQAQESADQGSQQLQQQQQKHSLAPLNKIDHRCCPLLPPQTVTRGKPCYRCGGFH